MNLAHASVKEGLTTDQIFLKTTKALPKCLSYRLLGTCLWIVQDGINTRLKMTPKVRHFIPELVVSVYPDSRLHPWYEIRKTQEKIISKVATSYTKKRTGLILGGYNQSALPEGDSHLRFKEVHIVGYPIHLISKKWLFLPAISQPLKTYYHSLIDIERWRLTNFRGENIVLNAKDDIQANGFILQGNDAKAATVIAERAAMIVTNKKSPHLFTYLSDDCGEKCTASKIARFSEESKWQLIYPSSPWEKECMIFSDPSSTQEQRLNFGEKISKKTNGNYLWVLWRRYQGCVQTRGKLIQVIDF